MEADLALGFGPSVVDAARHGYAARRRVAEQPRAFISMAPIQAPRQSRPHLPSRFCAWEQRNAYRCDSVRHGVALLWGFESEPSG
jgi:hypothetical protein